MSKRCDINKDKGVMSGNNRSHSNIKTKRRFMPNLQPVSLISDSLGTTVKLRISTNTLRTIDHNGGLDNYLMSVHSAKLSDEARALKRRIVKARIAAQAA
ncbi:MAG: 50S ribosomal protein L28 [Alphaproteobacteria bacterium]|nr:50S ribosomal protein L28 [Alphaproteobacteria bacterium]